MKAKNWVKGSKLFTIVTVVGVLTALFLGGIGSPADAKDLRYIQLRTPWLLEVGDHGPFFLAMDKGFFAEEGLEVEMFAGKGSPSTVKLIGASDEAIFANAGYETMAQAVNQAIPVKGVFAQLQQNPAGIISLAEKPIRTVKDIPGKSFAVGPQSNQETLFYAVLKLQNIRRDQVKIVHAPFNMANTLLIEGKVDAMLHWVSTNVPILESKGHKTHHLMYSDMGVNVPANGLITNLRTINEEPDLIRRFLRASARGFQLAKNDPEAAIAALGRHKPKARGYEEKNLRNLRMVLELYTTPNTKDKPIGWVSDKDWDKALDVLLDVGWIDKKLPHEKYYTNEFNPGIYWPR